MHTNMHTRPTRGASLSYAREDALQKKGRHRTAEEDAELKGLVDTRLARGEALKEMTDEQLADEFDRAEEAPRS